MIIDEIFNVMKHFQGSYLNQCGELIISERGNVYFTVEIVRTKKMLYVSCLNGVQDRLRKESHIPHGKEMSSGEILYYVATTTISALILHKRICIGSMIN